MILVVCLYSQDYIPLDIVKRKSVITKASLERLQTFNFGVFMCKKYKKTGLMFKTSNPCTISFSFFVKD